MSDDILNDLQAFKDRQSSIRARLQQKKKEREGLAAELRATLSSTSLAATSNTASAATVASTASPAGPSTSTPLPTSSTATATATSTSSTRASGAAASVATATTEVPVDEDAERKLLLVLCDISLDLPSSAAVLAEQTSTMLGRDVAMATISALLEKFAQQKLLSISKPTGAGGSAQIVVNTLDINKLLAVTGKEKDDQKPGGKRKRENDDSEAEQPSKQQKQKSTDDSIESLLSTQSAKEKEEKKVNEEILHLLSTPTAKEMYLVEKFKTRGGPQLQEFCQYGTREECIRVGQTSEPCKKLHFKKIIRKHTDESLGDCSFLNTCFHMDVCKYVHYEIDHPDKKDDTPSKKDMQVSGISKNNPEVCMFPPQWIQCDLRVFNMAVLGKCAVVMADPPWDIHMELPYGTMSDDEMRKLPVPILQDDGFLFLWVTGRAMELGRECLELWGYKRVDELIWVKTNQLQRIIRTGRTGHWINHGKEHCLVGVKGNPQGVNKGLDCDVIVAEVRATSHKPDEIYGIIERLSPGTRKVELFGRPHNVQPNWITLGNQVEGVCLKDPDIVSRFREVYPDGNCMAPPQAR